MAGFLYFRPKMTNEKDRLPEWLKRLQENSWEIELLISGGAIFSLLQLSSYYIDWIQLIRMNNHLPGTGIVLMIGMVGIKILNLGFILHLIFRAYWIALVCINYVYPSGIDLNKIYYRKPFTPSLKQENSLKSQILRVDNLCGTVLYLTITSVVVIVGIIISVIVIIPTAFEFTSSDAILSFYLTVLLVYIFDLITFGLIRSIPILSYLIFPLFKVFDILTLRFIYGKPLLLFMSNVSKIKAFVAGILFIFLAVIFAYISIYKVMHWPNAFDNREYTWQLSDKYRLNDLDYMENWNAENTSRILGGISPKIVEGNYIEVFFRYIKAYDELIKLTDSVAEKRNLGELMQVTIDSTIIENVEWIHTRNRYVDFGISALIPLDQFDNGMHIFKVSVKQKYLDRYEETVNRPSEFKLPFWIDRRYDIRSLDQTVEDLLQDSTSIEQKNK